ncbi:MAG: N-acetyl sugar amidotransferase [Chitinophagales bacterium]
MSKQTVIVNGKPTTLSYRVCVRCVQDSTVPGIRFDAKGVCNFCALHDKLCSIFPEDERGEAFLNKTFAAIKKQGQGKKYDCVVGISGGRDSTYLLWNVVKRWGLRPLAVHFNDGFDNPVAGENMLRAVKLLGVELRTITSDYREGKELKIDFLKASTPDLNMGTDIGIASSLFGVAAKENLNYILIGQSFRTEGVKPLSWSFFDGDYLRAVHKQFGTTPLRAWKPEDPGFNLGIREMFYYTAVRGIKTILPFYNFPYNRKEATELIKRELGWVYPGAHYYDDLYHSLIKYVHRVKFHIDMNMNSDSALVRSGQMPREEALARAHSVYAIEDPKVIELCIKRLGLTQDEFDSYMQLPPKTFRDYPTSYPYIRAARLPIWLFSQLHLLPRVTYLKYFSCGE